MFKDNNVLLKIRVINIETGAEFIHAKVPVGHVEALMANKNLKVEVIGRSRSSSFTATHSSQRGQDANRNENSGN